MNCTEKFEHILNSKKHEFLMYRPGLGGEKLITLIYKYSKKYKGNFDDYNVNNSTNQTIVEYPKPYYYLFQTPQLTDDKNIVDTAAKKCDYNEIVTAEKFVNEFDDIVLLRCHPIFHSYFSGSSCLLIEDEKTVKYSFYLNILKTARRNKNEVLIVSKKMHDRFYYSETESRWQEIEKIILIHSSDAIYSHALSLFFSQPKEKQTIGLLYELLSKDEQDVNNELYNIISDQNFRSHISDMANKFNYETFPMSDYFVDGKLEQRFDIVDPGFRKDLNQWHEKNLELLDANNVDCTEFNF